MDEYGEMMAKHDAREDGVYLVEVFNKEKFVQHGIFNHSVKAREWMRTLPNELTCTCIPFIMNAPETGMTKKEDMN